MPCHPKLGIRLVLNRGALVELLPVSLVCEVEELIALDRPHLEMYPRKSLTDKLAILSEKRGKI